MLNIVTTVHGIHKVSDRNWQHNLDWFFREEFYFRYTYNFSYGWLWGVFGWILLIKQWLKIPSFFRRNVIKKFIREMRKLQEEFPNTEISIICHSFGSWIVYWALDHDPTLNIKSLVIVNGVVSMFGGDLEKWVKLGRIKKVYVYSSREDEVVKYAPAPYGKIGYWGLLRKKDWAAGDDKPYATPFKDMHNIVHNGEHSDVITQLNVYGEQLFHQLVD